MADTIKKSRIVSDENPCDNNILEETSSLQDIINEEFNQRLKNCMKDEELENNEEESPMPYENDSVLKNGLSKNGDLTKTYTTKEDLKTTPQVLKCQETEPKVLNNEIYNIKQETQQFIITEKLNGLEKPQDIPSDPENDSFTNDENLGPENLTPEEPNFGNPSTQVPNFENPTPPIPKTPSPIHETKFLSQEPNFENPIIEHLTNVSSQEPNFENPIIEHLANVSRQEPNFENPIIEHLTNVSSQEPNFENPIEHLTSVSSGEPNFENPIIEHLTAEESNLENQELDSPKEPIYENLGTKMSPTESNFENLESENLDFEEQKCTEPIYENLETGHSPDEQIFEEDNSNSVEELDFGNLSADGSPKEDIFDGISAKDRFLSTVTDIDDEEIKIGCPTAKDRLFLATDSACLLFTQTVQSPMLTPTDENYDFLQGLSNSSLTPPEDSPKQENLVEVIPDKINSLEDIKNVTQQFINIEKKISVDECSTDNSIQGYEKSDGTNFDKYEIDGEIPMVKITDVTPESEEKELDDEENTINSTEEIMDTEIYQQNMDISDENLEMEAQHPEEEISTKNEEEKLVQEILGGECIDEKTMDISKINYVNTDQNGTFETVQKTKEIFEKISSPNEPENFVPKSYNLIKRLDTSPNHKFADDDEEVFELNNTNAISTTTTSESSFMETTTESKSSQDKALKKKKSKKAKKDNEKENISVNDFNNTNDEDCLSHVSVRNLCRSFSDLTSINDSRTNDNLILKTQHKTGKSSFSKFDALQKKTVLHVRSSEASKAPEKFNGAAPTADASNCKFCSKQVFQMEQIKAEKAIWHKNCFRCKECNKQLTLDTYQSNEGIVYCKPHFKSLFTPKAVEDNQPIRPRKHELIIRENQPEELPPDVVRASDKPDLGLEELQNLNVKERFQVFQHQNELDNNLERTPSAVNVKRSPSILSKLARFQQKGMDIGVNDESLNGVPVEESSSEEEEEEDDGITGEDADLIRAKRAQREKPLHFNNMSDIMSKWESGNQMNKEERREERKQEIQSIRSRLFMGKQAKIKEMYQQAVAESESGANVKKLIATEVCENAKLIKEKFEKGETLSQEEEQKLNDGEDMSVFDSGISKKSRSIFLELDANASKAPQMNPISPVKSSSDVRKARDAFLARQVSEDVVRSSDHVDDVTVETKDISNRFKFFEAYKEPEKKKKQFRITPPREGQVKTGSPDRDIYLDPEVVRSEEQIDDSEVVQKTHTATKMLSIFRQMEENSTKDPQPVGLKPLKRFTPPPEGVRDESDSAEDDSGTDDDESDVESDREDHKFQDNDLVQAQKAARAKHLRAKFEKWEATEIQREQNNSSVNIAEELGEDQSQVESAKSLRARFESMREVPTTKDRPKVKVNRFVAKDTTNNVETCKCCEGRVYPLEKVACHNNIYHKNCFRCRECNTILRLDSYTYNQGLLYCTPHFKRLFIAKGNYESGFGLGQHKEKWNTVS